MDDTTYNELFFASIKYWVLWRANYPRIIDDDDHLNIRQSTEQNYRSTQTNSQGDLATFGYTMW